MPASLAAFGTETVTVGDEQWFVAVADTAEERRQGLRLVADLGSLDGMIFVWPDEIEAEVQFTMRTVPIPLDIGFFDAGGTLFDVISMEPCGDSDDCPLYGTAEPFQFAIERPAGGWNEVPIGSVLSRED